MKTGTATDEKAAVRTLRVEDLVGSGRLVRIEHNDEIYTLRITRNGRLILTK